MLATACGARTTARGPALERRFDVDWHEHATVQQVAYTARHIVFHAGRWSADITLHNGTGRPLYPAPWEPAATKGFTWNGPALVYSGLDVLGSRRLIFVPADRTSSEMPFPLRPGGTWSATVGGKVPSDPRLPRRSDIWLRYSVVSVGAPWANVVGHAMTVDWISQKAVQL